MSGKEPPPPYTPNIVPGIHQQAPSHYQATPYPHQPTPYPNQSTPYPPVYPNAPTVQQSGYPCPYPTQEMQPMVYTSYGTTVQPPATTTTVVMQQPEVIIVGGCPACRVGILEDNYGLTALCCAILFFPAGILCCLLMKERRCSHCGAVFD